MRAAEGRIEESKESEGEETEEDEDQEPPEDTEDEMEALAQLPASSSPQQQEFEDKQSSGGDVDIIGEIETLRGFLLSSRSMAALKSTH